MNDVSNQKPCPSCGKPAEEANAPFCSRRCADVDLGRWFTGNYVIAGRNAMDFGDDDD